MTDIHSYYPYDAIFTVKNKNDGTSVLIPNTTARIVTDCRFETHVPVVTNSKKTVCVLEYLSGYSEMNLIVLDEMNDSYIVRILGGIGDVKDIDPEKKFTLLYQEEIPIELFKEEFIYVVTDVQGRTVLKQYIKNRLFLIGFFHRDDMNYSLSWKN